MLGEGTWQARFSGELPASVSGDLELGKCGKQVEKGRVHSFPCRAASQERPCVVAGSSTMHYTTAECRARKVPLDYMDRVPCAFSASSQTAAVPPPRHLIWRNRMLLARCLLRPSAAAALQCLECFLGWALAWRSRPRRWCSLLRGCVVLGWTR